MKLRDIFVYFIIALAMAVGAYQDHRLHQEIANKPTIIVEEYILPAPKEKVEAVIAQYYEEVAKASIKDEKSSPNVKIKPKKVIQRRIDIKSKKIINEIAEYIKVKEGFSATAYKDHGQYSIGYGTAAKSPNEKITIEEATVRLYHHIETIIIPSLQNVNFQSIEQVHSAIDFSYNLGHNTFKKNIVKKNGYIDCTKMMAYNKVRNSKGELVYNEQLAQRRFENFLACTAYEVIEE